MASSHTHERAQADPLIGRCGEHCSAAHPHLLSTIDESGDVDASEGHWPQAKIGQRRVAATDVSGVFKAVTKALVARFFPQGRAGISDGDKMVAHLLSHFLAETFAKVPIKTQRFGRRARFARDDEERSGQIEVRFNLAYGGRIGVIQDQKLWPARGRTENLATDLDTETTATHPKQHNVGIPCVFDAGGKVGDVANLASKRLEAIQPAESLPDCLGLFDIGGPEPCVVGEHAGPKLPRVQRRIGLGYGRSPGSQGQRLLARVRTQELLPFGGKGLHQGVVGVNELLHPFALQLPGDAVEVHSDGLEITQGLACEF